MAAPNWVIILLPSPHYLILHKLNLGNLDPPPSPCFATTQESVESPRELNCPSSPLYKDSPSAS